MKKTIILCAFLASVGLQAQIALPNELTSTNSNVGIGTTSPAARLQINGSGNMGGLLINAIGLEGPGNEGDPSHSEYILKATTDGNPRLFIGTSGRITAGNSVFNFSNATSMLNINRNLGVFYSNEAFFKINYPNLAYGAGLSLLWNNTQSNGINDHLAFRFGTNNSAPRVLSMSPTGNISFGNTAPTERFQVFNSSNTNILNFTDHGHLTLTNVNPDINTATSLKQTYGLSIVNSGWRNHDYALSVTTGHGQVFTVSNGGTVHIGGTLNRDIPWDPNGDFKLWVEDGIRTERVKVDVASANNWADYVFEDDYVLMPIEELEAFIKKHKHLPGVPSAQEVVAEGIDLAEMNKILLEKIEELTLRIIELEKKSNQKN